MSRASVLRISSICIAFTAALTSVAAAAGTLTICGFSGGDPVRGEVVYTQTCVACHGANGRGTIPGAPNLRKKGGALTKPHAALTHHVENGYSSPSSPISMPPKGGNPGLSVQDIKDVHAYMHKAFGCGK